MSYSEVVSNGDDNFGIPFNLYSIQITDNGKRSLCLK